MQRSYSYVCCNTAEDKRIGIHVISEHCIPEKREEAFGKTYISPVDGAIRDQGTMETLTKNSRNHIISMRREQHGQG